MFETGGLIHVYPLPTSDGAVFLKQLFSKLESSAPDNTMVKFTPTGPGQFKMGVTAQTLVYSETLMKELLGKIRQELLPYEARVNFIPYNTKRVVRSPRRIGHANFTIGNSKSLESN